jgi:hypothetical protein
VCIESRVTKGQSYLKQISEWEVSGPEDCPWSDLELSEDELEKYKDDAYLTEDEFNKLNL